MIGEKLRELRKAKGITADILCQELGITVGSYRNYERNDRNPPYETLIKIADYYNVTLDYLLGREKQKEKPYHLGLEKGLKEAYISLPTEVRAQILQAVLDAVLSYRNETAENQTQSTNYISQQISIEAEKKLQQSAKEKAILDENKESAIAG